MIDLIERDFEIQDPSGSKLLGSAVEKQHFSEVIRESSYVYLERHKPIVYLDLADPRFDELLPEMHQLN